MHVVADVVDGQDGIARDFLLDTEQPVRANRVLGVSWERVHILCSRNERRVGRRVVYRKWRICEDRLKDVDVVARERGHVRRCGKVEVHRIVEKPAVRAEDGLSLASRLPGETHARCPVALRRGVCSLVGREKRLGGDIEILSLVRAGGPYGVVVVPESKVQSELVIHFPIVLDIKIPVGIAVANKSWVADFLQNENIIVYEVRNAAVVVDLLGPQPLIVPVDTNLRAKFKRVAPDCLTYIVKNLEIGKRSDLIEEIRSGQRPKVREKPVKTSKWSRGVRIRVGIE